MFEDFVGKLGIFPGLRMLGRIQIAVEGKIFALTILRCVLCDVAYYWALRKYHM